MLLILTLIGSKVGLKMFSN